MKGASPYGEAPCREVLGGMQAVSDRSQPEAQGRRKRATCSAPSTGWATAGASPPPSAVAVPSGSSRPMRASMSPASHACLKCLTTAVCSAIGVGGA